MLRQATPDTVKGRTQCPSGRAPAGTDDRGTVKQRVDSLRPRNERKGSNFLSFLGVGSISGDEC